MIHLFCSWKYVPINLSHIFLSTSQPFLAVYIYFFNLRKMIILSMPSVVWVSLILKFNILSFILYSEFQFSSVQSLSHVRLFATPWTVARQACLSITNSWSLPRLMSIEFVMPSNHLVLHHPLLLLPSIFPNIRVFSNESALRIRWPKYWSFSLNSSPSSEHLGLISFRMDWLDLLAVQGTLKCLLQYHGL